MTAKTAIEALFDQANSDDTGAGYHVTARFHDGSEVDAPILEVGHDWMKVDELGGEPRIIATHDALTLDINWSPGQAYAEGPRFEHWGCPKYRSPGMGA